MKKIATLLTILLLGGMTSVQAEDVKVSQVPLSKSAAQAVAPNLLFILDDSGSMAWITPRILLMTAYVVRVIRQPA